MQYEVLAASETLITNVTSLRSGDNVLFEIDHIFGVKITIHRKEEADYIIANYGQYRQTIAVNGLRELVVFMEDSIIEKARVLFCNTAVFQPV